MSAELQASRRDATLILTLSNPGMGNALHADMSAAAIETMSTAERDSSIKVVVVTGSGKAFSIGTDLALLAEGQTLDRERQLDTLSNLQGWIDAIRDCSKPVIAAVEHSAIGAGFSLSLACDMIVAGTSARFAMSHAQDGLPPEGGGSWFIARALPRQLAAEILMEGQPIGAQRLHALGLVNRVVPDGQALDAALSWADEIARLPSDTCERIKILLRDAQTRTLGEHFTLEKQHLIERSSRSDAADGVQAFLRKRQAE